MLNEHQKQQVEDIRRMDEEELYNTFWKCMNIKYGDGKELFWGRDIDKAFPKEQYRTSFISQFDENKLYYISEYNYQNNTVEFAKAKIWGMING